MLPDFYSRLYHAIIYHIILLQRRVVILIPIVASVLQQQNIRIHLSSFLIQYFKRPIPLNFNPVILILQNRFATSQTILLPQNRLATAQAVLLHQIRPIPHRRQHILELYRILHKRIIIPIMHNLPVNDSRVHNLLIHDLKGNLAPLLVHQPEPLHLRDDLPSHHLFPLIGQQMEYGQLVEGLVTGHGVHNLSHGIPDQLVRPFFRQEEPVPDHPVYLIAAAAADGVVGMVFHQFLPDRF